MAGEDLASAAITRLYQLLHTVIAEHQGFLTLQQGEGDSVIGVSAARPDVAAASVILRAIEVECWPTVPPLRPPGAAHQVRPGRQNALRGGSDTEECHG